MVALRKYEILLGHVFGFMNKNPTVVQAALENAHKFVPERVFTIGGEGGGLAGPAAILGDFLGGNKSMQPAVTK